VTGGPVIDPSAEVAPSATVVGKVRIGPACVIDHGAVIASTGPPVELGSGVVVMANAVVRSAGGRGRPAFPVSIGADTVVGPQAALAGCRLGDASYVATGVMVFHGARVGAGSRLGAGAIVHAGAELPEASRVGMRCFAAPAADGVIVTAEVEAAREAVSRAGFFARAFGLSGLEGEPLHRRAAVLLRRELGGP
jgi:carbonic anhydrase/acetyltransferase-like protein (isoleucine patch superfamily)